MNPLLAFDDLPPFTAIRTEHVEPAMDALLAENRRALAALLAADTPRTWDALIQPVEDMEERLDRMWAPVAHLNTVCNDDALRAAYNACLAKLSDYHSELGQNRALYEAYKAVAEGGEPLDDAQRRTLDNALRDFRLSGVALEEPARGRFREIQRALSRLESKFEENVLDSTQSWFHRVEDRAALAGLPENEIETAHAEAGRRGLDGWVLTLDQPVYLAVLTHADDRSLRETLHHAWVTRAATSGPHPERYDNTALMDEILGLRRESANLLGYDNYASLSLENKMAPDTDTVLAFLDDLTQRTRTHGQRDIDMLRDWATGECGLDTLEPWDVAWVAERMRKARFDLSQEMLRPYFPAPHVVAGMFGVAERLFGIRIRESGTPVDTWHSDVRFYEITDADGELRGRFYLDLYTRKGKRGGAWMGECISRSRHGAHTDLPAAWLVCNFSPPVGDKPGLLSHEEVTTLFHEFGHGLHHMLTRVDVPSVAGINGVEWDAVELPSQFMENWCWEREALDLFATHWETGEPLPASLFERMVASRHFLAGLDMLRQLEFAQFDFRLHLDPDPDVYAVLDAVRESTTVTPVAPYNRFPNSFTHIFGGGYAAGYYGYKWAEVLSADAFGLFSEMGIFNRDAGQRFLRAILERGGVRDAMELFVEFRGREPKVDALLQQYGIAA